MIIILIIGAIFTIQFTALRDYSTIRSYYQESLSANRNLSETVQESIELGEQILLILQDFQLAKNENNQ